MANRSLKILFVALQAFWMVAILPGHVRGKIVFGGEQTVRAAQAAPSCCSEDAAPVKKGQTPSPDRQARCAVCYQAHGYTLPPVYDFDLTPTGRCELLRLIEATKLYRLLCSPTYDANAPPVA